MTARLMTTPFLRVVPVALLMALTPGAAVAQAMTAAPDSGEETRIIVGPEAAADDLLNWQETITGQIVAFRSGDPGGAFSYAGKAFHMGFPSAEAFFIAIMGSGYAPIMQSRSHSFGGHEQLDATTVAQVVRFVGQDQLIYEAIYVLGLEEEGWRVHGVQLGQASGVGI